MKIWTLILVLVSCVVGFVMSYGFAYKQTSGLLYSSAGSVQAQSTAFVIEK